MAHFENALEVHETIGDVEGIATAKANIALAKSKYEGDNNNEEVLKACQELYELHVIVCCEKNTLNYIISTLGMRQGSF